MYELTSTTNLALFPLLGRRAFVTFDAHTAVVVSETGASFRTSVVTMRATGAHTMLVVTAHHTYHFSTVRG